MTDTVADNYCGLHHQHMTPDDINAHGCRDPDKQAKYGADVCRWLVPTAELESYIARWKWERTQNIKKRPRR